MPRAAIVSDPLEIYRTKAALADALLAAVKESGLAKPKKRKARVAKKKKAVKQAKPAAAPAPKAKPVKKAKAAKPTATPEREEL